MSPSEKIRALLDERGIEYTICMPWNDTAWEHDGTHFTANERFGKIYLQTSQESLTPEQAIAATVGVGTCEGSFHKSGDLSSGRVPLYYCKGTNKSIFMEREARFCPLCGKRIEEATE